MRVAFLGNFSVPYSTESHLAASLEALDCEVTRLQEGSVAAVDVPRQVAGHDLFLWVQTLGLAEQGGSRAQRRGMVEAIRDAGVASVSYHLDKFFGLSRAHLVAEEPFFHTDLVFTADGGHQEDFAALGINHRWLPPGIYHGEAVDGTPKARYASEIVFVGSWRSYGHPEHWRQRRAMLRAMSRRYGRRFVCWPKGEAVRGLELNDLYASCKLAVGDSCLAGQAAWYWSDRIPETFGRGALLVHPDVEGLQACHPWAPTYPAGDFEALVEVVDHLLGDDDLREDLRRSCAEDTRTNHTYLVRMRSVLEAVHA